MPTRVTGLVSGMDTESLVSAMVQSSRNKVQKYTKAQTKLSWTQEAWKGLNTKVYGLFTNISNLRFSSGYSLQKVTVSNPAKATATSNGSAVTGTQKLNVISMAQSAYMTGADLSKKTSATINEDTKLSALGYNVTDEDGNAVFSTINVNTKDKDGNNVTKEVRLSGDKTIGQIVKELQKAGVNANFDQNNHRFYINATESGTKGDFSITADGSDANSTTLLNALGLNLQPEGEAESDTVNYATMMKGTDAKIRLNGVLYESDNNNFSVNGLSIAATGVTGDGDENAITLTTDTDTQGLYDKIKDFLTEYNNIINEITKLYNADSAKGYEPLTDDEKNAMSDKEVEKWETKIKDSLLRRDSTLNGVMQSMILAMAQTYEVNGKKLALSNFGIDTLGILNSAKNEQNAYHIDGDADDVNTSGKTDKLMEALNADPNQVIDFMKALTSNLYNQINDKMKATSMSSAYTLYNDKQMTKDYQAYAKQIKEWEQRVSDKEEYYYKKYSKMEAKLSQLQQKTSSLTGMTSN